MWKPRVLTILVLEPWRIELRLLPSSRQSSSSLAGLLASAESIWALSHCRMPRPHGPCGNFAKSGPQYRPQHSRALISRTPKTWTPTHRNSRILPTSSSLIWFQNLYQIGLWTLRTPTKTKAQQGHRSSLTTKIQDCYGCLPKLGGPLLRVPL